MKKRILNDEAKAKISNPDFLKTPAPGMLIDLFSIGGGEFVIASDSKEESIVNAPS